MGAWTDQDQQTLECLKAHPSKGYAGLEAMSLTQSLHLEEQSISRRVFDNHDSLMLNSVTLPKSRFSTNKQHCYLQNGFMSSPHDLGI